MLKKIIIAAIAENGVIGDTVKGLPWHIPEEFKHFRTTTIGSAVLMGRTTWREINRPLKERLNLVLTDQDEEPDDRIVYCRSYEEAFALCEEKKLEKIFLIGGRSIFASALAFADELILSYLKMIAEGDILFPRYDETQWELYDEHDHELFTVRYFRRKLT